jgi:fluoride exporter
MMLWLIILGAALGAPLRYLTDQAIRAHYGAAFPWGTLTVNVVGSLILGVVAGATLAGVAPQSVQLLIGIGLCGTLTTYSTFSYETLRLLEEGSLFYPLANVVISVSAGVGAAFIGVAVGQAIWLG